MLITPVLLANIGRLWDTQCMKQIQKKRKQIWCNLIYIYFIGLTDKVYRQYKKLISFENKQKLGGRWKEKYKKGNKEILYVVVNKKDVSAIVSP